MAGSLLSVVLLGLAVLSSTIAEPSFWERLLSLALLGLAGFVVAITEPSFWKRLTGEPEPSRTDFSIPRDRSRS